MSDNSTYLPILGLSKDTDVSAQPENTLTFALNVVHDSVDGSQGSVVNENSNRLCVELDGDICGVIPMNTTYQVIFTDAGCIYKVDLQQCTAELLVKIADFGFSTQYPITGEYRVVRGCEDVIYWRDSLNQDRWCNLTTLSSYPDRFTTINDFALNPNVGYPDIAVEVLTSGGNLEWGSYSFIGEMLDDGFNVVLRTLPTEPVQIGPGLNLDNATAEEGALPNSNKSIKLTFTNLDTDFRYLRIAVLRSATGDGITTDAHYVGEIIPYASIKQSFIYRGFNTSNGDTLIDKNSVLVPFTIYDTSRVMEQVQGRLVRANLTEQQIDYSSFQRAASKICTRYVVSYDKHRSEQGDEVKAYGIVYVFRNGTISPVCHIPGRAKLPHDATVITTTLIGTPSQEGTSTESLTVAIVLTRSGTDYTLFYQFSQDIATGTVLLETATSQDMVNVGTSATIVLSTDDEDDFVELSFDVVTVDGMHYTSHDWLSLPFDDERTLNAQGVAGTEVEYWQLYNTAVKDATPMAGYISSGEMGYYEVAATYSNPPNFCGIDYWGADCNGNLLAGTPIRHHRIPCRTIEPLTEGDRPRYIGVYFSNIEYPHADIVGHYFVTSLRDETTATVIASGYMVPYNYEENNGNDIQEGRYIHYLPNANDNGVQINSLEQNLITNEFLFDGKVVQGDFVKVNGFYQSSHTQNRKEHDDAYKKIFLKSLPYSNLELYGKHHLTTTFSPQEEFIGIEKSILLPSKSIIDEVPNRSHTSDFNILTLSTLPGVFSTTRANLNYVYIKSGVPVLNNLAAIRYRPLTVELGSEDDSEGYFSGDVFISRLDITNISSVSIGSTISNVDYVKFAIPFVGPALALFDLLNDSDVDVHLEYELIQKLWIESVHDLNYRHQGLDCNRYYDEETGQSIDDFIITKVAEVADPDEEKRRMRLRSSFCIEWYGYNDDLSKLNDSRTFISLPYSYNFCSSCLNSYPNRLIWSERSFEEDLSDNYRVFKANNYFDNAPHRGSIQGLTYKQNYLLLRTEESSFVLQPNPQQLQADGTNIYIGTGDFLSIPPYEMASTDLGYGGQQGTLASANTPHGLVWVDTLRGKVFSHADSFEETSRYKLYHWFEQNLKSFLIKDFHAAGFTLNFDQVRVAYDSKFERTIIHKTDYKFTQKLLDQIALGNVVQSGDKLQLKKSLHGQPAGIIEYTDSDYFENKSFTISYSHRTKTWISWHSYQPHFMLTAANTFGSIIANQLWLHDDYYSFGKFFGIQYDSVIEFVDRNFITQNPHAIHYYSQAQQYVDGQWVDANGITYTDVLVYNRNQSTGKASLVCNPATTLGWSNSSKPVMMRDKNYKIAQLRDLATGAPVNTSQWSAISSYFSDGQGYIDLVPNAAAIDVNKAMHELNELRDKYAVVRLFFSHGDYKLVTYLIHIDNFQSVR